MDKIEGTVIYVTIGVPFSHIPIMQKVMTYVDFESGINITDAAKNLRKMVADNIEAYGWVKGTNFKPSELYYEIYGTVNAESPIRASLNAPFFNQAC